MCVFGPGLGCMSPLRSVCRSIMYVVSLYMVGVCGESVWLCRM